MNTIKNDSEFLTTVFLMLKVIHFFIQRVWLFITYFKVHSIDISYYNIAQVNKFYLFYCIQYIWTKKKKAKGDNIKILFFFFM